MASEYFIYAKIEMGQDKIILNSLAIHLNSLLWVFSCKLKYKGLLLCLKVKYELCNGLKEALCRFYFAILWLCVLASTIDIGAFMLKRETISISFCVDV